MALLTKDKQITASNLQGLGYVKNSMGFTDNVKLFIYVVINTDDNSTVVTYQVSVFKGKADEYDETFTDYNKAIDKYNELNREWDAYRDDEDSC